MPSARRLPLPIGHSSCIQTPLSTPKLQRNHGTHALKIGVDVQQNLRMGSHAHMMAGKGAKAPPTSLSVGGVAGIHIKNGSWEHCLHGMDGWLADSEPQRAALASWVERSTCMPYDESLLRDMGSVPRGRVATFALFEGHRIRLRLRCRFRNCHSLFDMT
jgi:hypothetical protein